MASVRPTPENADEYWHNIRLKPGGTIVRVGWFGNCWRTTKRPVTPKQAHELGWVYVGKDALPSDVLNY